VGEWRGFGMRTSVRRPDTIEQVFELQQHADKKLTRAPDCVLFLSRAPARNRKRKRKK